MDASNAALARGQQLAQLSRWAEALGVVQPAVADPATAASALGLQARCLLALGRPREAERVVAAALAHRPDDSYLHYLRGTTQLTLGLRRKALSSAKEAARLNPMSVPAQYLLVLCYLRYGAGYRGRARAAGQRALAIGPTTPLAYEAAGRAEAESGRRHRAAAEHYFRAGLALDPTDQDLALGLGDVLRRSGRHREANEAYLAAASLDPADSRARGRLSRLAAPGAIGGAAAFKGIFVLNGVRVVHSLHGHLVQGLLAVCLLLVVGAVVATAVKLYRNRTLPVHVRRSLRGDYVNAALSWLRAIAVLLLVVAVDIAVEPGTAGQPRAAALAYAAAGGLALWACAHFRYGPGRRWRDVRAGLHLRRSRRRTS